MFPYQPLSSVRTDVPIGVGRMNGLPRLLVVVVAIETKETVRKDLLGGRGSSEEGRTVILAGCRSVTAPTLFPLPRREGANRTTTRGLVPGVKTVTGDLLGEKPSSTPYLVQPCKHDAGRPYVPCRGVPSWSSQVASAGNVLVLFKRQKPRKQC